MRLIPFLEELRALEGKDGVAAIKKLINSINASIESLETKHAQLKLANMTPSLKDVESQIQHYNQSKEKLKKELQQMIDSL